MALASGSSINVSGSNTVSIQGGQLMLSVNEATLSTSEAPAQPDTIALGPGSSILTTNAGTDPGANVQLTVGNLRMNGSSSGSSEITSVTSGPGRGGNVQLQAGVMILEQISHIVTATLGGGGGGGDVTVNVGRLSLTDGASIQSQAQNFTAEGPGGNMIIQGLQGAGSAAESVTLSTGSNLISQTFGSSNGGQVALTSRLLTMDGTGTTINTVANDVGRGGNLILGVQQASLTGGATITTQTLIADPNAQPGPSLTVQGLQGSGSKADSVVLSGSGIKTESTGLARAGDISMHTKSLTITNGAAIEMVTSGTGGDISLETDSIDMSDNSRISSETSRSDVGQIRITASIFSLSGSSLSTNTTSEGRAGDMVVNAETLRLLNQATINSSTNASGQAGDITITGNTVTLNSGGAISSASTGTEPTVNFDGTTAPPGRAGTITITASGNVTSNAGTITTSAEANRGGDISITAHDIQLSNGTLINANSNGPLTVTQLVLDGNGQLVEQEVGDGNAGNIRIESGSTVLIEQSSVTTEASQASGGQITINAPDMIRFIDSPISTSVAGAAGDSNGGNISIDPDFVVLKGSQILAQAFAGNGGAIDVTAGLFLADPASVVDASSTLGVSGTVQINAPINNLSSVVARLSDSLLAVQALLRASCAAKLAQGSTSSFVERGRDGIPAGPDSLLASPYLPPAADYTVQRPTTPSLGFSGVQLRRLFRPEMPSPVTLISDQGGCVS
jgi:hypothetical protein